MRLLLIEDDAEFSRVLAYQLQQEGITADICADGRDALYYIDQNAYDLILLDRMLPHTDGISLLKKIRKAGENTPVIILTALGETSDKIIGLDAGADDYLVKPFEFEELMARIRSISRRPRQWNASDSLCFGDLNYFPKTKQLQGSYGKCSLSKRESALMEFLIHNPNQILPRQVILNRVWGPEGDVEEGNIDNYIYFIRRRLKSVSAQVTLKTIRSIGYRLEEIKNDN